MYAWQTLTLAKVQYRGNSTEAQAVVKDVLYRIGLPHFPDPVVFTIDGGMAVGLRWDVEGRALQIDVDQIGVVSYNQFHADGGPVSSGGVDLGSVPGRNEVSVMVGWLLFGERELPSEDALPSFEELGRKSRDEIAKRKAQKLRDENTIRDLLDKKQRSLKEVANDVVGGLKR